MQRLILILFCSFFSKISWSQEIQQTILFDFNRSEIPDTSMLQLIRLINTTPIDLIHIEGHCDSVGSKQYNKTLSLQRANAVKKLLISNGMLKTSIKTVVGYGKDKPLNQNEDEWARQMNRRVFIRFFPKETLALKMDFDSNDSKNEAEVVQVEPQEESNIKLENFTEGSKITLNKLLFFGGSHQLIPSSIPDLEKLVGILKENPSIEIQIQGHVCCTTYQLDGFDWDTGIENLSIARAEAIYQYLISHGIASKRLSYKGFGGTQKINFDERTEKLRRVNRRVDLLIIKD